MDELIELKKKEDQAKDQMVVLLQLLFDSYQES